MLNYFAVTVTKLWNGKKFLFSRKQVTTYLSEFQTKIYTLQTLPQGAYSQHFCQGSCL